MGRNEHRTAFLLEWFAVVGPIERVSHCGVVISNELPDPRLQIGNRFEASTTQTFALNDAKDDLDLIEPRTVLGQVDEADAMCDIA